MIPPSPPRPLAPAPSPEGPAAEALSDMGEDLFEGSAAAAKAWLHLAFQTASVGSFGWDIVSGDQTWSEEFQALYGLSPAEAGVGLRDWLATVAPEDRPAIEADLARTQALGERFDREIRIHRRDGQTRWMHVRCILERDEAGRARRLIGVSADITARKNAEHALAESEEQLRLMRAAGVLGAYIADYRAKTLRLSPALAAMLGLQATELTASRALRLAHPEDRSRFAAALRAAGDPNGTGALRFEGRVVRDDGAERWLALSGQVSFAGEPQSWTPERQVGLVIDVTERKRVELALAMREANLRSVLATAPDAMVVIDANGIVQSFSAAASRMFGYGAEEVIGRNVTLLMPPEDAAAHPGHLARYLQTGEANVIGSSRETFARRRDGVLIPVKLHVGEVTTAQGRAFVGFISDLTEKRAAEARMSALQAEIVHVARLNALGEFASALAHELNQPLAASANYLNAAQRTLEAGADPGRAREALQAAADQQVRAGQIIQRLRGFLRKADGARRPEPLAPLIREACALALTPADGQTVRLEVRVNPEDLSVPVDRVQIQQVALNLVRNAVDALGALPPGQPRRITITAEADRANAVAVVRVRDNGPGIDPDFLPRLFAPFATTKPDGMGIGLRISRSIIEAHGGTIEGRNLPAGGAEFWFTLPLA